MRHQNQRSAMLPIQLEHQFYNLCARGRIQIASRFVGQQQLGLSHECARDGDALLLAPESWRG